MQLNVDKTKILTSVNWLCFKLCQHKSKVISSQQQQQQQQQQQEVFLSNWGWTCLDLTGACRGGRASLAKLQFQCRNRQDEQ